MIQNNSSETAQVWADRLERFDQADITVAQFCQNENVSKRPTITGGGRSAAPRGQAINGFTKARPPLRDRLPESRQVPARHACSAALTGHRHGRRSAGRHSYSIRDPGL